MLKIELPWSLLLNWPCMSAQVRVECMGVLVCVS